MRERFGRVDEQVVAAPDVERALLKQQHEAEGQQDLPQMVAAERAHENPLHRHADDGDRQCRDRDRQQPRPGDLDHRQRDIAAEQKKRAMRQIDDAHDPEDQRQAAAEQEQQRAVRHTVEHLQQPELHIHRARFPNRRRLSATLARIAPAGPPYRAQHVGTLGWLTARHRPPPNASSVAPVDPLISPAEEMNSHPNGPLRRSSAAEEKSLM